MTNWIKIEDNLINTDMCADIVKYDSPLDNFITICFKNKDGNIFTKISFTNRTKANREFKRLQYLLTKK